MKTPRRSRNRFSKDKDDQEIFMPKVKIKPVERNPENVTLHVRNYPTPEHSEQTFTESAIHSINSSFGNTIGDTSIEGHMMFLSSKTGKKRRRDKHRNRYSPELGSLSKEHKRKRKKKSLDIENPNPHPRITIKVKKILRKFELFYFSCGIIRLNRFQCPPVKWHLPQIPNAFMSTTKAMIHHLHYLFS